MAMSATMTAAYMAQKYELVEAIVARERSV